ncbi:MAG TPA: hypothetical protein VFO31_07690, partial [Vicinamibacterales bacterium]|nr:hypothetical protein [Vicinamibacterales bacterium]
MLEHARTWTLVSFGLAAAAMLTGCSGSSDVGDQKAPPPVAWAKALNQPFTGADGDITVTARAGSEVFLTGKDSDGGELPVLDWTWTPLNGAAEGVDLVTRNSSTVSFSAPQTSVDQELRFRLTVTNSNGASDDAEIVVNVVGVPDPGAFLQYDGARQFVVGAVASETGALGGDVRFKITVERRITYWDLQGQRHVDFVLGSQQLTGEWLAAYGTDSVCGAAANPRFTLPLPTLDADDVLAKLSKSPSDQSRAPDPSRIDEAQVTLRIGIELLDPLPDRQAGVCVLGADASLVTTAQKPAPRPGASSAMAAVAAETTVTLDALAGPASTSRDTRASARAYYATIDPGATKDTLAKWLAATGFTDGSTSWTAIENGSSAHAVYLNNFDLGFGRDMYMRFGACDGGTAPALGGAIAPGAMGTCDVYGVVINYASLEAAAKKTGALLAVAMEYARLPGAGANAPRVTTFYTFAPDASGVFKRVLSANLDGRGERYMPQACTVCHGGTPQGVVTTQNARGEQVPLDQDGDGVPDAYGNGGNVKAGFMSWDLDSFLFSDNDPAFSNPGDPYFPEDERVLAERHTRAQQKDGLRKLNQMAWLTYADPDTPAAGLPGRFEYARRLVESWYGGPGLPA